MGNINLKNIRGIILAAGWTKDGQISDLDIAGFDEKKYRVVNDEIGTQLQAYIHQRINADGVVVFKKNRLMIYVHHFQIDSSRL
jgi:hypothetical protein